MKLSDLNASDHEIFEHTFTEWLKECQSHQVSSPMTELEINNIKESLSGMKDEIKDVEKRLDKKIDIRTNIIFWILGAIMTGLGAIMMFLWDINSHLSNLSGKLDGYEIEFQGSSSFKL